jgi:prepilin-type N-terminal cleavage/methylation domain-containing protein
MQRKLDNKAFTFVEIIVVVIILGILGTIGFSQFV